MGLKTLCTEIFFKIRDKGGRILGDMLFRREVEKEGVTKQIILFPFSENF